MSSVVSKGSIGKKHINRRRNGNQAPRPLTPRLLRRNWRGGAIVDGGGQGREAALADSAVAVGEWGV
ncbi:hypothetical protein ACHAXS_000442 [Conticribra weissflogii]